MAASPTRWTVTIAPSPQAVQDTMIALRDMLADVGVPASLRGNTEIAVAEALNNVVEHACAGQTEAHIELSVLLQTSALCVVIQDNGTAMPGLAPPKGTTVAIDGPRTALPEGGFGWHLIHSVADRAGYSRQNGQNRLELVLSDNPSR